MKESGFVKGPTGNHGKPRPAMPPAGSKRKAKAPAPSAAEGCTDGGGAYAQKCEAARGLDPAVVKEFLGMLQRRDRLGPEYFSDVEREQWNEWLDAVPGSVAESVDAKAQLPVRMPRKCLPRPAAGSCSAGPSSMGQQEIITYSNTGGRRFSAADRRIQYAMRAALVASDVPMGSTVAIQLRPRDGYAAWVQDTVLGW